MARSNFTQARPRVSCQVAKALLASLAALIFLAAPIQAESFRHWMRRVYRIAPAYDLELHPRGARLREAEEEWFHLYYWQGNFTPREAVMATVDHEKHCPYCRAQKAKQERSEPLRWSCSYVCYVKGEPDSVGCRIVEAASSDEARKQFHKEVFGEKCSITAVEKMPPGK